MARKRGLTPQLFSDYELIQVSHTARLFFMGMAPLADSRGILLDQPKSLGLAIFPGEKSKPEAIIDALIGAGLVLRYSVEGRSYLQLVNFTERFEPHGQETPSKLPAPPSLSPILGVGERNPRGSIIPLIEPNKIRLDKKSSESDLRDPDPERQVPLPATVVTPPPAPKKPTDREDFEAFYAAYPRKKAPDDAWRMWQKVRPPLTAVLAALEWQRKQPDWLKEGGTFVPYPATYLNDGGWKEEPPAKARAAPTAVYHHPLKSAPPVEEHPMLTPEQLAEIRSTNRAAVDGFQAA